MRVKDGQYYFHKRNRKKRMDDYLLYCKYQNQLVKGLDVSVPEYNLSSSFKSTITNKLALAKIKQQIKFKVSHLSAGQPIPFVRDNSTFTTSPLSDKDTIAPAESLPEMSETQKRIRNRIRDLVRDLNIYKKATMKDYGIESEDNGVGGEEVMGEMIEEEEELIYDETNEVEDDEVATDFEEHDLESDCESIDQPSEEEEESDCDIVKDDIINRIDFGSVSVQDRLKFYSKII